MAAQVFPNRVVSTFFVTEGCGSIPHEGLLLLAHCQKSDDKLLAENPRTHNCRSSVLQARNVKILLPELRYLYRLCTL